MADVVVSGDNDKNNSQSFFVNKKRFILAFILLFIAIIGFFLYKVFYNTTSDDIKIGNQIITKQQIDNYENNLKQYNKDNNISLQDKSPKQVAIDDLVLNASLKNELEINNQQLSNDDLYVSIDPDLKSQMGPNEYKDYLENSSVILRTVKENKALQEKLDKKLITRRDILIVALNLDTPYYLGAKDSEKPKLLNNAQKKMQALDKLVRQNLSKEEISTRVDVKYFGDDDGISNDYVGKFYSEPVTTADYKKGYQVNQQYFNDLDSGSFMKYKPGRWYKTDEQIVKLKKKGDITPIFASKTGNLMIVRLENINSAKFNSWSEALDYYKNKYLPKNYKAFFGGKETTISEKDQHSGIISSILFRNVSAATPDTCAAHRIKFNLVSVDITTGRSIGGTKLTVDNNDNNVRYFSKYVDCVINFAGQMPKNLTQYKKYTYTTDRSSDGIIYYDTCYSFEPTWTVVGHPAPNIWQKVSPTTTYYYKHRNPTAFKQGGVVVNTAIYPPSHGYDDRPGAIENDGVMVKTDYNKTATDDTSPLERLPEGFPDWQVGNLNINKWTNIYFYYRKIPSVEPRTSVSPTSVKVGQQTTFTHSVKNSSAYPLSYTYKVRRYVVPKNVVTPEKKIDSNPDIPGNGITMSSLPENNVKNVASDKFNPSAYQDNYTIPSSAVAGSKVCEKIFVYNISYSGPKKSSSTVCATVIPGSCTVACSTGPTYRPFFQVENAAILAGCRDSNLAGYFSTLLNKGSNSSRATLSDNQIIGVASSFPSTSSTFSAFSNSASDTLATPTNSASPNLGGNFGISACDFSSSLSLASSTPITEAVFTPTSTGKYSKTGASDLTVNGANLNGQQISIISDGDVFISGNIVYANSSTWNSSNMSSIVIKARNIYISSNVTQLDGTYIANKRADGSGGAIYTCASGIRAPLDGYSSCNKQLVVYGAFMAKKINLLRTLGDISDTFPSCKNSTTPAPIKSCAAELFIFSPEVYLNGTNTNDNINNASASPYDLIYSLPPIL